MTKGKNYQRYPAEFKRMALLKASGDGVTANSVCEDSTSVLWCHK